AHAGGRVRGQGGVHAVRGVGLGRGGAASAAGAAPDAGERAGVSARAGAGVGAELHVGLLDLAAGVLDDPRRRPADGRVFAAVPAGGAGGAGRAAAGRAAGGGEAAPVLLHDLVPGRGDHRAVGRRRAADRLRAATRLAARRAGDLPPPVAARRAALFGDWGMTMLRPLKLTALFIGASAQHELAYRANFWVSLLNSALSFGTGLLGVIVLFEQVESVRGWEFAQTLAVLGVYMTVSARREVFISASRDSLAGMDGEIWRGEFDFTLLRPVDTQFVASVRHWRLFSLVDLLLGFVVLGVAVTQLALPMTLAHAISFVLTLLISGMLLYAILLA